MELLQLKYFIVTAKYEHMTKASNALHIAQPALSQSIKRLEEDINIKLFRRVGRNIALTEEGLLLRDKVIPILEAIELLPDQLSQVSEVIANRVRVNILSASELITKIIISYKEGHPNANFQLSQKVDEDEWDVRISTAIPAKLSSSSHVVLEEEIFLAVPLDSPFAALETIDLIMAKDASFISLEKNKPFSVLTTGYCLTSGFAPRIVFESDSPQTVRDLTASGMGVAFWPAFSWGKPESDKVKLLHINEPNCRRKIFVAQNNEKSSSVIKDDFYKYILNYLDTILS